MNFEKKRIFLWVQILLLMFLASCNSNESSKEVSSLKLNECIEFVLSPTDYKKFLDDELSLEPYQDIIENCVNSDIDKSLVSSEPLESNELSNETTSTSTSTSTTLVKQKINGFSEEALNASEKWPMVYFFNSLTDSSEAFKVAKTSTTLEASRVDQLKLVFSNCNSNIVVLENTSLIQTEKVTFINENCPNGTSINSFKYLQISNLNYEIRLFKEGQYENISTGEKGCCHTLNLKDLVNQHTSIINTFFATTTTTTTTIPYPPTAEIESCIETTENNVTISFPFVVNAPSSKVTSIRVKTFLNGSLNTEEFFENNPNIELTPKNSSSRYVYDFVIPNKADLESGLFEVYVLNERGQDITVQCGFNVFVPDRSPPGPFGTVLLTPREMDLRDGYFWATFEATTQLKNADKIKRYSYKLISNEFNELLFTCEITYPNGKNLAANTELSCYKSSMRLNESDIPSYVEYSLRGDEGLSNNNVGWYRLELEVEDMAGNIGRYTSCKALRVYRFWSSFPSSTMKSLNQDYGSCG